MIVYGYHAPQPRYGGIALRRPWRSLRRLGSAAAQMRRSGNLL